jgi:hypothetical protein
MNKVDKEMDEAIKKHGIKKRVKLSDKKSFEKDKKIITNYLIENNYTKISNERLQKMNPKYTKDYADSS